MPKRADGGRRDTNGGVPDQLTRLLNSPHLAQVVPRLAPEVIHDLIQHRGLGACVTIVAAATPQQLASILDLDLWQPQPGGDDRFDEQRFGAWIEALIDEGEAVAARVVGAMNPSVAIAGLSRYVRVFDPGVLPSPSSDDDLAGAELPSQHLECAVGGYTVRARTAHAWDAIVGLLVALADQRPDCFHALMQGCRRLSNSRPEADGFYDLMLEPDQLLHDVSLDREHRRTQQGYLSAADARAYLQMARQPRDGANPMSINPIAAAYFRTFDDEVEPVGNSARPPGEHSTASNDPEVVKSIAAVVEFLTETGSISGRPRALLGPASADVARLTPFHPLMQYVLDSDAVAYFRRNRELAFLANVLLGGGSVDSRPFTVEEAWNAAVSTCNLGLEAAALPDTFLVDHDLVSAFEDGWRLLHEDVSMFVAGRLTTALTDLRDVDSMVQRDLYLLRRELERNRHAGMPWKTRDSLEVIAILDVPTWACLRGLLNECPVLPAALAAIMGGSARSVSATAFECFSTREQIHLVHVFAGRLRELLS